MNHVSMWIIVSIIALAADASGVGGILGIQEAGHRVQDSSSQGRKLLMHAIAREQQNRLSNRGDQNKWQFKKIFDHKAQRELEQASDRKSREKLFRVLDGIGGGFREAATCEIDDEEGQDVSFQRRKEGTDSNARLKDETPTVKEGHFTNMITR